MARNLNNDDALETLYPLEGEAGYVAPVAETTDDDITDDPDDVQPKPGEEGYVPKIGEEGYVLKEGDPGYVPPAPQPGDADYVDPNASAEPKFGEEGYVLKPGDTGYVPPARELTQDEKDKIFQDYLKAQGFESIEQIKSFQAKALEIPETEEQKTQRLADFENNMTAFAINNKLITATDIAAREELSNKDDRSIAMKEFAAQYKAAHKDRTKEGSIEPDPVKEDEIEEAFNEFYHLDSSNAALKTKGELLIKERADLLRSSVNSKFDTAKQRYETEVQTKTNVPAYRSFLQETISKAIAEQIIPFEEGESKVVFNLKDEAGKPLYDLAALEREFVSDPLFHKFVNDKDKSELQNLIKTGVENMIYNANRASINKLIYEQGRTQGKKEGSVVGAKVPFKQGEKIPPVPVDKDKLTQEDLTDLKSQFAGSRR